MSPTAFSKFSLVFILHTTLTASCWACSRLGMKSPLRIHSLLSTLPRREKGPQYSPLPTLQHIRQSFHALLLPTYKGLVPKITFPTLVCLFVCSSALTCTTCAKLHVHHYVTIATRTVEVCRPNKTGQETSRQL